MDPIRLFVADDVGIGKTVEACLIVRELLDRGEISAFTVLAPPHLVTQWQTELATKFHIDAAAVLAGNVTKLERECRAGQSLFEAYPFTIVSMDFIKSERRRHEFIQHCPEMVVVDEAHTCAWGGEAARSNQQRHALLEDVCRRTDRHVLLVSATPHSGDEQAFRSLLKLLNPNFAALPSDLSGDGNRPHRERLARHFVQRKRADIAAYLGDNTKFPKRNDLLPEPSYKLHADYRKLFDRVWQYTRESISTAGENKGRQRVRWCRHHCLNVVLDRQPE
ncbi:MAG: DEAD/DEAH box helicase [Phycisphaerales bacterium]